ncbi:hypothetical protein CEUSTIGMA_g8194.t1 [Chlamydomonas eustigma]|uniref:Cyclic nucleotide-binding domain-containing protein n=1 Tax=Chlamydomonas eustigma TaxID=1157962 RepID=A0A250XCZ5_9CHLO|nr:hypothetical protein CEUSTIGMA_g8194.t1 [Chlamydomonas eustigma]|eukprot:GAX80759.1 hypothetical protein CEUSTIGMA_g8194.t1 [Chlamydomonas eustigma]
MAATDHRAIDNDGFNKFLEKNLDLSHQGDNGFGGLFQRLVEVPRPFFKTQMQYLYKLHLRESNHDVQKNLQPSALHLLHMYNNVPKSVFGLPMIPSTSFFAYTWVTFMLLVDIFYTAFWVPINVAFCSVDYGALSDGCSQVELIGGCVYFINMMLAFQFTIVLACGMRKVATSNGRVTAVTYMWHSVFWLDLLSVSPFIYLVVILASGTPPTSWVTYLSLLRLLRMLRVISLTQLLYKDASSGVLNKIMVDWFGGVQGAFIALLTYVACVIVNLEACILLMVAFWNGTADSWLASITWLDAVDAPYAEQWYMAIFMTIISNTGTGSWGIHAYNLNEMIVFNILMVTGMVMYGVLVAVVLIYVTTAQPETKVQHQLNMKIKRVHQFIRSHGLPNTLANQLEAYYRNDWVHKQEKAAAGREELLQSDLPEDVRGHIALSSLLPVISFVPAFDTLSIEDKKFVCARMSALDLDEGYELCEEGEQPECLWLLEEGEVEVCDMHWHTHRTVQGPAILGDAILIMEQVPSCMERPWGYRTLTPCRLWRLGLREITSCLKVCPEIRVAYLDHVEKQLHEFLSGVDSQEGLDVWYCELVARITSVLKECDLEIQREALQLLKQANWKDMTLQVLLDAFLEVSAIYYAGGSVSKVRRHEEVRSMMAHSLPLTMAKVSSECSPEEAATESEIDQCPNSLSLHSTSVPVSAELVRAREDLP